MRHIMLAMTLISISALSGACTTTQMSAKSGPGSQVTAQDNRCSGYENRRNECADQVGCGWDNSAGTCVKK